MSKSPNPWHLEIERGIKKFDEKTGEPRPPLNYYWVRDNENSSVALFTGFDKTEENKARLFAAAPDLLAALENAIGAFNSKECNCDGEYVDGRMVGHACYFHRVEQDFLAAIAKATGGSSE